MSKSNEYQTQTGEVALHVGMQQARWQDSGSRSKLDDKTVAVEASIERTKAEGVVHTRGSFEGGQRYCDRLLSLLESIVIC
jgi:hypothetical protein